jgi:hypothetical protein
VNRLLRLLLLAPVAGGFALAVHLDFPLCPLASTLGIPCPGCGLTRATLALMHGDVNAALHFHPLVWLLSPLFIGFVGAAVLELVRAPAPPGSSRRSRFRWNGRAVTVVGTALLIATFGVWLARFAGAFGGPVPVTSMRQWLAQHH